MKKIKLAVITPTHWAAFMGGAQYQTKCIIDELLKTGNYEITYFAHMTESSFRHPEYTVKPIGRRLPRIGYTGHALQLYKMLGAFQPDVIYQRVGCGYSGVAAFYAKRNQAKMIWHVAHDGDVSPGKLDYGRNPIRRFLELASIKYAIQNAQAIVTQTNVQADLLKQNHGRIADAIVPNFHPPPQEPCHKNATTTVAWVANIKRWKNPDAFIRLAEKYQSSDDLQFVMAGAAPPGKTDLVWYRHLLGRIDELPYLTYLGQQNQNEINELLAKSHIFVNTSFHEGFANTFIQAWLREVPIVSLHVNPDGVFNSEEIGFYTGSEDAMFDRLNQLISDRKLRDTMGQRAAAYACERHSSKNIAAIEKLMVR